MVNVVARSPSNVDSAPAVITVDGVAPAAPVIDPSNGTEISGTAEAGATVILTDGGGNPIGQATADGSGNWTFTPGTPLANGTVINAVAQDPAGNTSGPASVTVDAIAPPAPVIDPSNGVVISGTAEAGATVILTDGNGNPVGQVTADGSGNWAFTPATPLANGTVINALAQDAAGNNSSPTSATVDSLAPAAPVIDPSNGSVIAGTAEAGATVILTDGNGNPIGQVTADGSGNWSFTPGTPLSNGTVVNAVAQDAAGNTSGPASTTVDSVAPAAPVIDPSNGSVIAGTAEAGATVILTDGGGNPIGQATADGSGNWTFTPGTPLANGTVINAVAQDPAGNTSGPASTTVDAVAPATPVVNPSNGSVIAGTAEAGATVILTDGGGNPIGQATADGSGNWSFTPGTPLANGSVVNAVAQDAAGNTSGPASTTVDSVAPATPVLDPSNGTVISGTAEAGATVILTDGGGNPIGQATADGSGNWSFTPGTPLANGSVINAVAQDAAGNTSGPVSTTVDAVAPATPVIDPSNGVELSGTAEPGVRVILTDGNGNPIGQTLADGSGNWSFTPGTPLANGTVVNAVAQDPAGNTSGPASTTVDTVAPATPVINASNGSVITGTAEVGAKVILTDGNGNPIGETTADGSGNWTFTPGTPLANGTVINAVAEDAAGNASGPASTTVDHRRQRQPDRRNHRRRQRQLDFHARHAAGQRHGGQRRGPGPCGQYRPAGQHYRGRGGAEHACGQSEQRQPAQRYRRAGQHRDLDRRQRQPDRPDHRRWQRQLELHARLATAQRHRGQRDRERRRRQYQPSRYHDGGFLAAVDPAGGSEQRFGDQRHRGRRQHHHHHRWQRQPDWPGHRRRQRQLVLHSRHPAAGWHGGQRGGAQPKQCRQCAGGDHGGWRGPGGAGDRSEQRHRDKRYRGSWRDGDPHRWRRQPDRPGHRRRQRQLDVHPGHPAGQRHRDQRGGPGPGRQHQRSGQRHRRCHRPAGAGDRSEQRSRHQRYGGSRGHGDPHRRQRQPGRPGHRRRQRQLGLHARYAVGQWHGDQCAGPGRRRQQQQSHQRHRRLAGASSPGDRSEQR
ncbi:hypothetical protein ACS96_30740 [Pseudomonas aeruginosa]|nr:hypothetical protein ACS96_30740 [Pseudomonas aeruginosa]